MLVHITMACRQRDWWADPLTCQKLLPPILAKVPALCVRFNKAGLCFLIRSQMTCIQSNQHAQSSAYSPPSGYRAFLSWGFFDDSKSKHTLAGEIY